MRQLTVDLPRSRRHGRLKLDLDQYRTKDLHVGLCINYMHGMCI